MSSYAEGTCPVSITASPRGADLDRQVGHGGALAERVDDPSGQVAGRRGRPRRFCAGAGMTPGLGGSGILSFAGRACGAGSGWGSGGASGSGVSTRLGWTCDRVPPRLRGDGLGQGGRFVATGHVGGLRLDAGTGSRPG